MKETWPRGMKEQKAVERNKHQIQEYFPPLFICLMKCGFICSHCPGCSTDPGMPSERPQRPDVANMAPAHLAGREAPHCVEFGLFQEPLTVSATDAWSTQSLYLWERAKEKPCSVLPVTSQTPLTRAPRRPERES